MEYKSVLKNEMTAFLDYYKSMKCDIRGYITIFNKLDFVLLLLNLKEKNISKEIAEQFASAFTVRNYTFYNYISHYNVFARYLNSIGIYAYELELPKLKSDYTPYIFDDEESDIKILLSFLSSGGLQRVASILSPLKSLVR